MEKQHVSNGHADLDTLDALEESSLELETTHEVKERAQSVIELSRELTSSSRALLEQIEPSA